METVRAIRCLRITKKCMMVLGCLLALDNRAYFYMTRGDNEKLMQAVCILSKYIVKPFLFEHKIGFLCFQPKEDYPAVGKVITENKLTKITPIIGEKDTALSLCNSKHFVI